MFYKKLSILISILVSFNIFANEQILESSLSSEGVMRGNQIDLVVKYSVTNDNPTTGIGFRVFFDGQMLTNAQLVKSLPTNRVAFAFGMDTSDLDNDPNTDRFLNIAWSDPFGGNWPSNSTFPLELLKLRFDASNDFKSSQINYRSTSTARGYDFIAPSINVPIALDTNNNLDSLSIGNHSITPGFSADITAYEAVVSFVNDTISIDTTAANTASILVLKNSATVSAQNIPLDLGENNVSIRITAENGDIQDYVLSITRLPKLSVSFDSLPTSLNAVTQTNFIIGGSCSLPDTSILGSITDNLNAISLPTVSCFNNEFVFEGVDLSMLDDGTSTILINAKKGDESAQITQSILLDSQAPNLNTPQPISIGVTEQNTIELNDPRVKAFTDLFSATDDLSEPVSIVISLPNQLALGRNDIQFSATDAAGNNATSQATVTVTDQGAPVITAQNGEVSATNASGTATSLAAVQAILNAAQASDAIDGEVEVSNNAPETLVLGVNTITLSATDSAGNQATQAITITVVDQTKPELSTPSNITVAASNANGTAISDTAIQAFLASVIATDNVDTQMTVTHDAPATLPIGTTTVTFTVTDSAGNTQTVQATITVADANAPILTAPGSITVAATDANGTAKTNSAIQAFLAGATATDNVTTDLSITNNAPAVFALGVTSVTFSVSDGQNTTTAQATVTVTDQGAPVITAQNGEVSATNASGTATSLAAVQAILNAAQASDAIDGEVEVSNNAPETLVLGVNTITLSATDSAGNQATQAITITVVDQTKPELSTPSNITVAASNANGTAISDTAIQAFLASVIATDNVDTQMTVTHDAPATLPIGTTTVTFTVTDSAGNTQTVQATITVADANAPILTAPGSITVAATDANGTAKTNSAIQAFLAGATATDNVTTDLSITNNAPAVFALGVTSVTFSVSDGQNTTTAQATVTVTDQGAPVITAQNGEVSATNASGTATSLAAVQAILNAAQASDAIDGEVEVSNNAPETLVLGVNTITLSATDSAGNQATQAITITVVDQTKPELSTPSNITVAASNANGTAISDTAIQAFLASVIATDNVDTQMTVTHDAPATLPIGTTTVTFTVTDSAGNTQTVQATITVADANAPILTAPGSITVAATDANGTAKTNSAIQAFLAGATATDNVTTDLSITNNAPAVFALGVTSVTFSVSDGQNTTTAQATVTVTDQGAPVITAQNGEVSATNASGTATSLAAVQAILNAAQASDAIDGEVEVSNNAPETLVLGVNTITLSATDSAGNQATQAITITVVDQTKPELSTPSNITVAASNANGTAISDTAIQAFLASVIATDNVDTQMTVTHDAPATLPIGTTTVTFTVTDSAGNTQTVQATITVADANAPILTAPGSITVAATDANGTAKTNSAIQAFLAGATATDNVTTDLSITNNAPAVFALGVTSVTFSVSDGQNTTTAQATVTVTDQGAPVITAQNGEVSATNASGTATSLAAVQAILNAAQASDAIDGEVEVSNNAPETLVLGVNTITLSATDSAGNQATQAITITVVDQTKPELSTPSNITVAASNANGTAISDTAIQAFLASVIATDNVDTQMTVTHDAPATLPIGTTTVTFTVTDSAGNTQTVQATITVADANAPILTAPGSITVAATDANGTAKTNSAIQAFLAGATATDNVTTDLSITNNAPAVFALGVTSVTFSVSDGQNTTTAQATVTVTDQGAPVITAQNGEVSATNANGTATSLAAVQAILNAAQASDAIDGEVEVSNNAPETLVLGVNTITLSATDSAGNQATQAITITVVDQTKPELSTPSNITVAASNANGTAISDTAIQAFLASVIATDNVDTQMTVTHDAPATLPIGTTTVTFTVTDSAGNTQTVQATITVADANAPILTAPGSITVAATDANGTAKTNSAIQAFLAGATATDNVTTDLSITNNAPAVFALGVTSVTFSVSDGQNTTTAQATVTVTDQGAPVITAQNGEVSATNANGTATSLAAVQAILNAAQASDAIDGEVEVSNNAPETLVLGVNTITLSATDSAGNQATQAITITVVDQTKPELSTPSNITVAASNANGTAISDTAIQAFLASVIATDNVDTQMTVTHDAPATLPIGTTTVTFTVTDSAGNTQTVQATITVADANAPILTAPGSITVAATDANGTAKTNSAIQAFLAGATATDNVTTDLSITNNAPAVFALGVTSVTFSVSDGQNTTTAQATVTVTDQGAPVITAQNGEVSATNANGTATSLAAVQAILNAAQASDAIDGEVEVSNNAPETLVLGVNTITLSATDSAGNQATQAITITVVDQTKPELSTPSNITVAASNANGTAISDTAIQAFLASVIATDNVDTQMTVTHDAPATLPIGTTTVTFTVTDSAGNTQTVQATITVADANAPILTAPGSITVAATDANGTAKTNSAIQAFLAGATATDNVTTDLSITNNAPAVFALGVTSVTFSVSDGQNTTTAQATVTVTDQGAPVITAQNGEVSATNASGTATSLAAVQAILNAAQASDAIDGEVEVSNNAPETLVLGVNTITLSATDSAGNQATQAITITVVDQTKPELSTPSNITVAASNANGTAISDTAIQAFLASVIATDNVDTQMTVTHDAPATLPIGTTTVTFTVTDSAGNTQTVQATITVADANAPILTAPGSITVAATDANGTAKTNSAIQAFLAGATATDNVTTDLSITNNAPAVFALGVTSVTFSVSDGQNTTTAQATVTVTDQGAPVITAQNGEVSATNASGTATSLAAVQAILNAAQASDAIDGEVEVSNNAPETLVLGVNTITLSATDSAGNQATQAITITVVDQTKPELSTPSNITVAASNANGTAISDTAIQAFLASVIATDNVDTQMTVTHDAPATLPIGTTTVTFTVTDSAGNTQTVQATITIADANAPILTAPGSITVAATDANGTAKTNSAIQAFLAGATATDNVTTDLSITNNAPAVFALGVTSVTFSVSDGQNTTTAQATVTVTDQGAPVITAQNGEVSATNANGTATSLAAVQAILNAAQASDAIDGEVEVSNNAPETLVLGVNTITLSATDSAGNQATQAITITVVDQTKPELSTPSNITVAASNANGTAISDTAIQAFLASVIATDNVDTQMTVTHDAPATLPIGTTTVTFTVTDSAGNTQTVQATITVADANAPILTAPGSITVAATDANGTAKTNSAIQAFLAGATATDNVTTDLSITNNAPAVFALGVTSVTFSVSDGQNTTTAQATVTVTDQGAPVITAQNGEVSATNANGTATSLAAVQAILNAAQASDAIDGEVEVSNNAPETLVLGVNTITLSATDSAGNQATQAITITVVDQTKPELSTPSNITVAASNANGTAISDTAIQAFLASVIATDNVDTQMTVTHDAPATLPIGTTTVTFTVTDSAGNTQTVQATITIADANAPILTAPGSITVAATDANGTAKTNSAIQAFLAGATATDNVTTDLSITNNAPAVFALGVTSVTFSVSDGINTSSKTSTVSVTDQTSPVFISELAPQVLLSGSGGLSRDDSQIQAIIAQVTASDNVDSQVNIEVSLPLILPVGDNAITAIAKDIAGNVAQMLFTIIVKLDPNAPELFVPEDIVLDVLNPTDTISQTNSDVVNFANQATAVDELDGDISNQITHNIPVSMPIGSYTITFTVTDSAGNTSTDTAGIKVIIRDTDEDGLPDHVEISNGLDPNDPSDAALDSDGDGVTNLSEYLAGTDLNVDDVAPILTIPADIFVMATGKFTGVQLGQASAFDAKDGELIPVPSDTGPFESGITQILWTVNDIQGNVSSATQMIYITPLVTLTPDSIIGEGSNLPVNISLSGDAITYPVKVTLELSGTATIDDYDIETTQIIIESGTTATTNLNVIDDNIVDTDEEIVITIIDAQNAKIGNLDTRTISIVEENIAPIIDVVIFQNEMQTKTISQDGGDVSIQVLINDVNINDEHIIEFDENSTALPNALLDGTRLNFSPDSLSVDVYGGEVTVTDNGTGELSTRFEFVYRVIAATPLLLSDVDSDGDGISDADEGLGDADNDGIPDYEDNIPEANLAPIVAGSSQIIEASPGTKIALGKTVFAAGTDAVGLTEEQVNEVTGSQDNDFEYPTGLLDFVISGAKPGDSYRLVFPLGGAIPDNAVFRKFSEANGWSDFVEDANNSIASALDVDGACPTLNSSAYQQGLTQGDTCLELLIEDGGPNDTDGAVDGKVTDPSGIAIRFFGPPSSVASLLTSQLTELFANSGDTSTITLTAMDIEGRLLEGLSISSEVNNGQLSNFVEQGNGVYIATYTAGSERGVASITVSLSDVTEQASIQTQITLKKRDSGGSISWLYLGLLILALRRRVCF